MRTGRVGRVVLSLLLVLAPGATPATIEEADRAVRIIDVDHLRQQVMDITVVDVRAKDVYLRGHIPPARPLDVEALARLVLTAPEPDEAAILRLLHRIPARGGQPLVIYDVASRDRQDGFAAWLLAYSGFPDLHVLDGSFSAWFRRKNLGVFEGHPMPMGRLQLRAGDLQRRLHLRVDPGDLDDGPPAGTVVVDVLPIASTGAGTSPAPGQVRVDELLDGAGFFLFPYHLEKLLASRDVDHTARLALRGETLDAAFAWVAFTANGFDAALVEPMRAPAPEKQQP